MRTAELVALAATGLLAGLAAVRLVSAARAVAEPATRAPVDDVTVLVPVRSGDPLLPTTLARSAATLAPARVLLLVDEDDPAGRSAAQAAVVGPHVEIRSCAAAPPGVNPKVHKLAAVAPGVGPLVGLLDDDTVLPPGGLERLAGALAAGADLVTGIPVYREQGGPWSRLVAAFVNGSAVTTYLPMARTGPPVTVNGMVLLTRQDALRRVGGLAAITGATCDDYALARAYRAAGLRIVQTAQPAELATSVPGPLAYARLMRRWLLFGTEVLRRDASTRLVLLVVLPSVLPAVAVVLAGLARSARAGGAVAAVLLGSAVATRALRHRLGPAGTGALGVLLEPVAAVLTPLHAVVAVLGPRSVVWRGRRVRVGIGATA